MIRMENLRNDNERFDAGETVKGAIVRAGELAAARKPRRQRAELAQPERALKVAQAIIVTEAFHLVAPRLVGAALAVIRVDAVAAKTPHLIGRARVGGRDHAALAGRDVLDGVKAEDSRVGDRADLYILIFGAERVTCVGDQR